MYPLQRLVHWMADDDIDHSQSCPEPPEATRMCRIDLTGDAMRHC
jgi:hypothetical protein